MSYKVKTLIVIDNMSVGGIATSLYNFLHFQAENLECHLLVFDKNSIDYDRIPKSVRIIETPKLLRVLGLSQKETARESRLLAILRFFLVALSRIFNGEFARDFLFLFIKKIGEYDFAISYAHDNAWKSLSKGCNDYVIKKVSAKKKMAYIHCDYSNYGGYDRKQEKILGKFDYIGAVSESCRISFCNMFPNLESKSVTLENYTDIDNIIALANVNPFKYDEKSFNFVSVCRISSVKGLDRTIIAFNELYREGFDNFNWIIVGDGPEYENYNALIKSFGLDKRIVLVGQKDNPYSYIKGASALLLPSVHEAAPMVFSESAALGVPIITTNTCSAIELVKDKNIGIVVENDSKHIKEALESVLSGQTKLNGYSISVNDINKNALNQFDSILRSISN